MVCLCLKGAGSAPGSPLWLVGAYAPKKKEHQGRDSKSSKYAGGFAAYHDDSFVWLASPYHPLSFGSPSVESTGRSVFEHQIISLVCIGPLPVRKPLEPFLVIQHVGDGASRHIRTSKDFSASGWTVSFDEISDFILSALTTVAVGPLRGVVHGIARLAQIEANLTFASLLRSKLLLKVAVDSL